MRRNAFRAGLAAAILLLAPLYVSAQWSSNPEQNLGVGVAAGEQVTPKIVAAPDSGCYISWFDSRNSNYALYLQRLNADGVAQWAANGLCVSNLPQQTWLVDYDLAVDPDGNAVVVFTDIRNGAANDIDVFAYKISPSGAFLWGAEGIGLSAPGNSDFEPAPKVAVTAAGNSVFAWMKSGATDILCFQKLSPTGQKLWGDNGFTLTGVTGHKLAAPDLAAADNDNVIALWKDNTGLPWAPTTWLYSQKFDPSGAPLWTPASGVLIYSLGYMSAWTYPQILADGAGGAFYTWYDSPMVGQSFVSVGHVSSAGSMIFPVNGILAAVTALSMHMNPCLAHVPNTDPLYVFWQEANSGQTQYGVYGQKFDAQGNRLWTDNGRAFVPVSPEQRSFVRAAAMGNDLCVGYFEAPNLLTNAVQAFKTDIDGNIIWGPVLLSSATLGGKDDLEMALNRSEERRVGKECRSRWSPYH